MFSRPIAEVIERHPFAREWTKATIASLADCAEKFTLPEGGYVWRQGEKPQNLYLICSGEAALEISLPQQGPVRIEEFGSGEVLGSLCLAPAHRLSFDARAVSDFRAVSLNGALLHEQFSKDHHLAHEVLQRYAALTCAKLELARLRLLDLYRPKRTWH